MVDVLQDARSHQSLGAPRPSPVAAPGPRGPISRVTLTQLPPLRLPAPPRPCPAPPGRGARGTSRRPRAAAGRRGPAGRTGRRPRAATTARSPPGPRTQGRRACGPPVPSPSRSRSRGRGEAARVGRGRLGVSSGGPRKISRQTSRRATRSRSRAAPRSPSHRETPKRVSRHGPVAGWVMDGAKYMSSRRTPGESGVPAGGRTGRPLGGLELVTTHGVLSVLIPVEV